MYQLLIKMSKKMNKTNEQIVKKSQNLLLTAYNATPKGECNNKLIAIAEECEVDTRTVRRWIKEGRTPKKWMYLIMAEIMGIIPPNELKIVLAELYQKH